MNKHKWRPNSYNKVAGIQPRLNEGVQPSGCKQAWVSEQEDKYKCGQGQMNTNKGQMKVHSQVGVNTSRWREGVQTKVDGVGVNTKGGQKVAEQWWEWEQQLINVL